MSTYTLSTYLYTDTDNTPAYDLELDHTSLYITTAGSIVTNGLNSSGVALGGVHDSLLVDGSILAKNGDGIYISGNQSSATINGDVSGHYHGIETSSSATGLTITVGTTGNVDCDTSFGIDLQAAYSTVALFGTSHALGGGYAIEAAGQHDTVTIGATGYTEGGIDLTGNYSSANIAGTITGNGNGAGMYIGGQYDNLSVSGHVSGYVGIVITGYYNNAKITGTVETTGGKGLPGALGLGGYDNTVTVGAHGYLGGPGAAVAFADDDGDTLINNGNIAGSTSVLFLYADNSTFINHGTVDDGIEVVNSAAVTIDNTGTIGGTYGISIETATASLINRGTIYGDLYAQNTTLGPTLYTPDVTIDNSGAWRATEFYSGREDFSLINSGTIRFNGNYGGGYDNYMGIHVLGEYGNATIINEATGSITGVAGSSLDLDGGTLENSGLIRMPVNVIGTIVNEATGTMDEHVSIYGVLNNYGAIHGSVLVQGSGATLANYGSIYGSVVFQSAATLVNQGKITGHVTGSTYADNFNGAGGASADWFNGSTGNDVLIGGNADDMLFGGAGIDFLSGGSGNDTLIGGGGRDTLRGGPGDDTLTGGNGSDVFVFAGHFGNDTVTDFTAGSGSGHDLIHFTSGTFSTFTDVQAAMSVNGDGNVVITLDANDTITLTGVHDPGDLAAQNFSFG